MHEFLKSLIFQPFLTICGNFSVKKLGPVIYGHLFLLKKVKMAFSLAFPGQKTACLLLSEIVLPSHPSFDEGWIIVTCLTAVKILR